MTYCIIFNYSSPTSSESTCPDSLRRICDHEIPTANTIEINTKTTQLIAVTLFIPSQPQSISNQITAEKNKRARIKPIKPSERNVARK